MLSEMDHDDWIDIAESEFVDYVESPIGGKVAFVFEHEELGLHGFEFSTDGETLRPVAFKKNESSD